MSNSSKALLKMMMVMMMIMVFTWSDSSLSSLFLGWFNSTVLSQQIFINLILYWSGLTVFSQNHWSYLIYTSDCVFVCLCAWNVWTELNETCIYCWLWHRLKNGNRLIPISNGSWVKKWHPHHWLQPLFWALIGVHDLTTRYPLLSIDPGQSRVTSASPTIIAFFN